MKPNIPFLLRINVLLLLGLFSVAKAQLTVSSGSPYSQYVTAIEGTCVEISNVVVNCDTLAGFPSPAMGSFNAAGTMLGLMDGLIITSGSIDGALPGGAGSTNNFQPGDLNLNSFPTVATTNDRCAVTFDLVADCDSVVITYVYASNEYPSFVGSFDDPFGIFVTGPGYTANSNVALTPAGQEITIFNIFSNPPLFFGNGGGSGYNGRSIVLEAVFAVTPGSTYTIKMVVADENDFILDTGVFIEEVGCRSFPTAIATGNLFNPDNPVAVEECVDGFFTFYNLADTSMPLTLTYQILGTATNGVDYNFPTTLTIPQGEDSIKVNVPIIADGIPDPGETIIIVYEVLPCFFDMAILTIQDPFAVDAGADLTLCSGEIGTLGGVPDPLTTYNWVPNIGLSGPLNSANPTVQLNTTFNQTLNYILNGTDINGCTDSDTVQVDFISIPNANFALPPEVCIGEAAQIVFTAPPVPGGSYFWDFDGASNINGANEGPYLVSWNTAGVKTVSMYVLDANCSSDTIEKTIVVNPIPTSFFTATTPVCENEPSALIYTGSASSGGIFVWDVDGGSPVPSGIGPHQVTWTSDGIKDITLVVEENGCLGTPFTQQVEILPVPTADFSLVPSVCEEDVVQITYTGDGDTTANYAWNFGPGAVVLSGMGQGPYVVQWITPGIRDVCLQVEQDGCTSPLNCQQIDVTPKPVVDINSVSDQCLSVNQYNFTTIGDAADSYDWFFGADAIPATSNSATPPTVVYQNGGIKTVTLIVTKDGCVGDSATVSFEVIPDPSADFTATTNGFCDDDSVLFAYSGTPVGPNQSYFWDFGPGAIPQTGSQPNPPLVYYTSGGPKTVTLTVSYKSCTVTSSQTITVNGRPIVSAGPDVSFCEGDGGVLLNGSVSGGATPYFYNWWCSDPMNCGLDSTYVEDPTANPDANTPPDDVTYYFQVTDVNGCMSNIDSVVVRVKAKPRMDAGPDIVICGEGPGDFLTGGPAADNQAPLPITYHWTPASGLSSDSIPNPFARPNVTTIYTLVGTSANGCTSDATTLDTVSTATVHVNPLPIAQAGQDTALCLSDTIQLQGAGSGAGPNYTYTWTPAVPGTINDPNSPTPLVNPAVTTIYTLVVTSNGCDSEGDQVEVIVDTKPTVSAGQDNDMCLGDSINLAGSADGDPDGLNFMYQWSPPDGLADPTDPNTLASPSATTTYSLTATSFRGCGSDVATVLISVDPTPEVEALSADTIICQGDEIELHATHVFNTPPGSPVTYQWSPLEGVVGSDALADVTVAPSQTTLFVVRASVGRCFTEDQVLVSVTPEVIAGLSADTTRICENDATQLFASGGLGNAQYEWIPAAGISDPTIADPLASPSSTTTYQVVISEGVCVDTAEITIDVNPAPIVDYFTSQAEGCVGLRVSFLENTQNANSFEWDFGDGSGVNNETNPQYTYDLAGEYPVTLTAVGQGGCTASLTRTIVKVSDNSFADFSSTPASTDEIVLPDANVQFEDLSTGAISWFWDFGDGNTSAEQSPNHTYAQAGNYTVTLRVSDENGCVSTVVYEPYVVVEPDLMIPNVFSPNGDGVNDEYQVRYTGTDVFSIKVFDRWGRLFFEADAANKPGQVSIRMV